MELQFLGQESRCEFEEFFFETSPPQTPGLTESPVSSRAEQHSTHLSRMGSSVNDFGGDFP